MFRQSLAFLLFLTMAAAHATESPDGWARKAMEAYAAGDYAASAAAYEKALALDRTDPVVHYNAACSHALDGRAEDAFRHLFAAAEQGHANAIHASRDPDLESLHDDPRWEGLLRQLRDNERAEKLRWGGKAFQSAYRENLDTTEKVAGLSRVWAEAKFGFANFDLVPALDWDARYTTFIPRVIDTESTYEYYRVMQEFVAGLQDGHSNVYPPRELYVRYSRPPLRTALIEGRVMIRDVMDAAMAAAGFRKGQEILAIDGVPVTEYARREVEPYQSASTPQDLAVRTYDYMLLAGDVSEPVVLQVRDPGGAQRTLTAARMPPAERSKYRPEIFELTWLPGDVAQVKLNSFGDREVVARFEQALPELVSRAKGIILDVRENGGGNSGNGFDILAHFSDEPFVTGTSHRPRYISTLRARGRSQTFDEPREWEWPAAGDRFHIPVAVLIGPRTYSAAEDFAAAFDQMKRGVLVGAPTGGSTGQPVSFELPGGGTARVCALRYRYADGTRFVGIGVQPDIMVKQTVAALRRAEDVVLKTAMGWVRSRIAGETRRAETPATRKTSVDVERSADVGVRESGTAAPG